jgi:hypothetical protein
MTTSAIITYEDVLGPLRIHEVRLVLDGSRCLDLPRPQRPRTPQHHPRCKPLQVLPGRGDPRDRLCGRADAARGVLDGAVQLVMAGADDLSLSAIGIGLPRRGD